MDVDDDGFQQHLRSMAERPHESVTVDVNDLLPRWQAGQRRVRQLRHRLTTIGLVASVGMALVGSYLAGSRDDPAIDPAAPRLADARANETGLPVSSPEVTETPDAPPKDPDREQRLLKELFQRQQRELAKLQREHEQLRQLVREQRSWILREELTRTSLNETAANLKLDF